MRWMSRVLFLILIGGICFTMAHANRIASPWIEGESIAPPFRPYSGSDFGGPRSGSDAAIFAGADYLVAMQADVTDDNAGNGYDGSETPEDPDDAGWDWELQSPPDPFHHTTAASPKNLYGVSALGIYYAYLLDPKTTYLNAMKDAADVAVSDALIRTASDLIFLMLFDDLPAVAGTTYQDAARSKYDGRMATYGGAAAFAAYLRDVRGITQGYPNGIIAWDLGAYVRAAAMLHDRYPAGGYDADADAIADVLWEDSFNDNPGLFDVVDDAGYDPGYGDVDYWWYNLGISGLIDAFLLSDTHTAELPWLVSRITDSQHPSGAIGMSYGVHTDDEDWQSTSYAAMSLGGFAGTYREEVGGMAGWMAATQDASSGGWLYSDGTHLPEVAGECVSGSYFGTSVVTATAPPTCITGTYPCVTVPFDIVRGDEEPMRAFSVRFTLSPEIELCSGLSSITQGSYLTGTTNFQKVSNGGGTYTVDCATLGLPCGTTAATGTLFNIQVKKTGSDGTGTVSIDYVILRDCGNVPIPSAGAGALSITIDTTPPVAVTNIAAAQDKTGNGTDGTTEVVLTFSPPGDADLVEVYRAPYGLADGTSAYPEYSDMASAGVPAVPSYPPSDPWEITAVDESGEADEPLDRGFWYYVVFTKDACGNVSAVSNRTAGTLNYHLGDVAPIGSPDNDVETLDISALGGSYGATVPYDDPTNILDVGPTADYSVDGLPTTDNIVEFEDLIMFAINYGQVGFNGDLPEMVSIGREGSGRIGLTLGPVSGKVRAGQIVTVPIALRGAVEGVQGVRTVLAYDPSVLAYEGAAVAAPIGQTDHFFKDLPATGSVDFGLALLGHGAGLHGEGAVFVARFRALRDGNPALTLSGTKLRDTANRELLNSGGTVPAAPLIVELPASYRLGEARPNPFNPRTTIFFDLPEAGAVRIQVFDVAGRAIRTLVDGTRVAGAHAIEWDGLDDAGRPLTSGIYFYTMQAGDYRSQRRMTLLK